MNLLSTLLKVSKQKYFTNFFKSNDNDMNGKSNNDSPTSIIHEGNFITDPISIVNVLNYISSTVAHKVQSKIKFSNKFFSDFLPPNIHEYIILSQITED